MIDLIKIGVGRPTLYGPDVLEKTFQYLNIYTELGHEIPSNSGLAYYLGVTRQTVYEWGKDENKKEFSYMLDRIQQKQEIDCLSKGLNGDYNSNIAKLVLTKHGYHDKQDVDTQGGISVTISSNDAGNL